MGNRQRARHGDGARGRRPGAFARVRALLAGALVLGVGATATLAAWTDQESATAQITAGTFALESQTALSTWGNHTDTAAVLSTSMSGMYPGQSYAAWIQIRTADDSVEGTVSLTGVSNAGGPPPTTNPDLALWQSLQARIGVVSDTGDCLINYIGADPLALSAVPTQAQLPPQSLLEDGSNVVTYCVVVTLPVDAANAAQGGVVTPTWQFTGTTPTA